MPLIVSCEKCKFLYEVQAFTKSDGTADQASKCPKCGNWNGMKYFIDNYLKTGVIL